MKDINILAVLLTLNLPIFFGKAEAQTFINGDLEGPEPTGLSELPPNWQAVPWTDPNCLSSGGIEDSPDLLSMTGPLPAFGVIGNPQSGSTFMSGVWGSNGTPSWVFQEGIMQTVSGFIPSSTYTVSFYQSVVKQDGYLDSSGSWIVYLDTNLIGITTPTLSNAPFNSTSFIWEYRSMAFTASSSSHTIKFLPWDDDTNNLFPPADTTGALRMGIDNISLTPSGTGVHNEISVFNITAYPNPTRNILTIEYSEAIDIEKIEAINIIGQSFSMRLETTYSNKITIDMSRLGIGLYILRIYTQTSKPIELKIMKE